MINIKTKPLNNIRHLSIRKKTASRICSTQILYEASFSINEIDIIIEYYLKNHLIHILSSLDIKNFDTSFARGLSFEDEKNLPKLDQIISDNLSKDWSFERLSKTEISILRSAAFELCLLKQFNKVTIINEYITIIEAFGGNTNFANGILEKISLSS